MVDWYINNESNGVTNSAILNHQAAQSGIVRRLLYDKYRLMTARDILDYVAPNQNPYEAAPSMWRQLCNQTGIEYSDDLQKLYETAKKVLNY